MLAWLLGHESCKRRHRAADDRISQLEDSLLRLERKQDDVEDYVKRQSAKVLKRIDREQPSSPVEGHGGTGPTLDIAAAMRRAQGR